MSGVTLTVHFEDVAHAKEAVQIVRDALLEFASHRGCRDAGMTEQTFAGAMAYVEKRYGDAEASVIPFDDKVLQVARRTTAARRAAETLKVCP